MIRELVEDTIYTTERLKVRQLTNSDFEAFHAMQGDVEVMKYVAQKANSQDEDRKDLEQLIHRYSDEGNDLWVWAIEDLATQNFVGTIALVKDKEDNWEIGYRLLRSKWGKGYATEALLGLIELCEQISEINNLIAYADRRNISSQKVLVKTGFINLGIKYNDEEDAEEYIYSISTT